jgi:hypothetical protein
MRPVKTCCLESDSLYANLPHVATTVQCLSFVLGLSAQNIIYRERAAAADKNWNETRNVAPLRGTTPTADDTRTIKISLLWITELWEMDFDYLPRFLQKKYFKPKRFSRLINN